MRKQFILVALYFFSSLLTVNAPSIGPGYGFITLAMALVLLFSPPFEALLVTILGGVLSLPLIYYSESMMIEVAFLGVVLRPIAVYIAGIVKEKHGPLSGSIALSLIVPIIATTAGILYYGDDGIHSSLSIYDAVTVFLTYLGYRAWLNDRSVGITGWLGESLFIISSLYFLSLPAAFAGLLVSIMAYPSLKISPSRKFLASSLVILLLGILLGGNALVYNAKIASYPLKPSSYTGDRWRDPHGCAGRTDLFEGVHDPARLRIVHNCVTVEAVVAGIPFVADDGDYCFDLSIVKSNTTPLTTIGNTILRKGHLHAEIIPEDRSLLESLNGKICKGDKLVIKGVHVVDTDHGQWAEIHPVITLKLVERGNGPCVELTQQP